MKPRRPGVSGIVRRRRGQGAPDGRDPFFHLWRSGTASGSLGIGRGCVLSAGPCSRCRIGGFSRLLSPQGVAAVPGFQGFNRCPKDVTRRGLLEAGSTPHNNPCNVWQGIAGKCSVIGFAETWRGLRGPVARHLGGFGSVLWGTVTGMSTGAPWPKATPSTGFNGFVHKSTGCGKYNLLCRVAVVSPRCCVFDACPPTSCGVTVRTAALAAPFPNEVLSDA